MLQHRLKRVVVKQELVELTGDIFNAIILNQLIYWSERVYDFDKLISEERHRMQSEGHTLNMQPTNGWIYKSADELNEETMLGVSPATMGRYIKTLLDKGYLLVRNNPDHKWDRTKQYRVDFVKVCKDLATLGYALDGYPYFTETDPDFILKNGDANLKNQTVQNERAIPEITTKTTTETINTHTDGSDEICATVETENNVCDEIRKRLGVQVNEKTIRTWRTYADDETIVQVVTLVAKDSNVQNLIGYVTNTLRNGFTPLHKPTSERDPRYQGFYELFPDV